MATIDEQAERLETELTLLQAMYPGLVTFDIKSRDFRYTSHGAPKAQLVLRIPDDYPSGEGMPVVISATDKVKADIRDEAKLAFETLVHDDSDGPILDLWIARYEELIDDAPATTLSASVDSQIPVERLNLSSSPSYKTVIIWLHHLLNTNKRKLAVSPSLHASKISGITKPGYPGVLLYAGRSDAINAHVRELKDQNWQAFQIRYDSSDEAVSDGSTELEWRLEGIKGKIVEVETMAELVKAIIAEEDKQTFLKVIGVK
jgi:hypothetical protein